MVLVKPETDEKKETFSVRANQVKSKKRTYGHLFKDQLKHCHQNCIHNRTESSKCTCDFRFNTSVKDPVTLDKSPERSFFCTDECTGWLKYHRKSCQTRKYVHDPIDCLCCCDSQLNCSSPRILNNNHTKSVPVSGIREGLSENLPPAIVLSSGEEEYKAPIESTNDSPINKSILSSQTKSTPVKSVREGLSENLPLCNSLDTSEEELYECKSSIGTRNTLKRKVIEVDIQFHQSGNIIPTKRSRKQPLITRDGIKLRRRRNPENQENQQNRDLRNESYDKIEVSNSLPRKRKPRKRRIVEISENITPDMSISDYKRQMRSDAITEVAGGYVKTSVNDDLPSGNATNHYMHTTTSSMATLSNIGNSCYLNSVIYTLRFAPLFLHNLHHLVSDLTQLSQRLGYRYKSSSLGRNVGGLQGSSGRSLSSKDLASLSINTNLSEVSKSNRQIVTEKLHELFHNLHRNELIDADPFHPVHFLNAIQDVSSTFEGNQQQDAHELLMCILDSIRETSQSLKKIISDCPDIVLNGCGSVPEQIETTPPQSTTINSTQSFKALLNNFTKKSKRKDDKSKLIKPPESPSRDNLINDALDSAKSKGKITDEESQEQKEKLDEKIKKMGLDFFCEDFEGITVSTTKCLTCETETEQKETMIDISVPISGQETMETMENPQLFFQNSCITKEYFRGENKYRCEKCFGYTEAIRSISFEVLPRLLVIQLKRFSGGMEKINSYIPTPFTLQCFCRKCHALPESKKVHVYKLYSVITHVGATLSAGHYIAYTCSLDAYSEYVNCDKDKRRLMQSQQEQQQQQQSTAVTERSNGGLIGLEKMVLRKRSWLKKGDNRSKASSSSDLTKNLKTMNGNTVVATANSTPNGATADGASTTCQALNCCGIHAKENLLVNSNGNNNYDNGPLEFGSNTTHGGEHQASSGVSATALDSISEVNINGIVRPLGATGSLGNSGSLQEPIWFMCDDDKIKSMPQQEFKELLSPNRKVMITPYLLFYARNDIK